MNFLPDGPPIIKQLMCAQSERRAAHATWDYAVHLKCSHPTHFIFMKVCDCCGIMTEQLVVEGKSVEITYTFAEVEALVEIDSSKPEPN